MRLQVPYGSYTSGVHAASKKKDKEAHRSGKVRFCIRRIVLICDLYKRGKRGV